MMNSSSCRPPAGKKLKRQVHPSPPAPRKIELEANKKANCFLNGNGWLMEINMNINQRVNYPPLTLRLEVAVFSPIENKIRVVVSLLETTTQYVLICIFYLQHV